MRRHGFGVFGALFLAAYVVLLVRHGVSDAEMSMITGICQRVGLVLGAILLAYPQLVQISQRVPPWLIGCILLAAMIVAIRPKAILVLAPIVAAIAVLQFVGWLFKPLPQKKRAGQRAKRDGQTETRPETDKDG